MFLSSNTSAATQLFISSTGRNSTFLTSIIDQNDLVYKRVRRSVDYTPYSAQQRGPRLIVKHNHYAGIWQLLYFVGFPRTATKQHVQQEVRTNILQCIAY